MKKGENYFIGSKRIFLYLYVTGSSLYGKASENWAAEWGYSALFSGRMSNKLGVAILFNNNFSFKILRQLCDKEGRYIFVDLEVGELTLTICNIYVPNTDDPVFFKTVSEQMLSFKCNEIILGGDFNLGLDISKDKKGGKQTTHRNSLKVSIVTGTQSAFQQKWYQILQSL